MASGSSGTKARPDNSRSGGTNSGNFVASNTGLDIPSHYASPRRSSQTYTSFFDPDYFVRPTTSNPRPSPIQNSPFCSSIPSTPSQHSADARREIFEQGNGYGFSTRNDFHKMNEKKNSSLSHADHVHLSQAYINPHNSMPQYNTSCYQAPKFVHPQSPTEEPWVSEKSSKIPYKRSYVSSREEQSRSNTSTPAKKACQQDIGHTSMKSETSRSPLDFGLDSVYAKAQEKKTHIEHVPITTDQKTSKLHAAAKSCESPFSPRPSNFWEPIFFNFPIDQMAFTVPEHWKSDMFTTSKTNDAASSSQFSSYQPETPRDPSDRVMQPNQARTDLAQTTSKHPAGANSSGDAISSRASTPTKLSENGLPLINKKDMMTFSSWRNKNKFVVYPENWNADLEKWSEDLEKCSEDLVKSGADLEKAWLKSINDETGQNPTELDRRRFYAKESKYPYEMLGELNEVQRPNPMDEIVVDETSNGQRVSHFSGWGLRTSNIFSKEKSLGDPARNISREKYPETDPLGWDVATSIDISTAGISPSSKRNTTNAETFRGNMSSDRVHAEVSDSPPRDYSNRKAMEKSEERERNASSNSISNSKAEISSEKCAKPEAQRNIKSDTKPEWKKGCSPTFGPNKPGKLYESKCKYCQNIWRRAQDWAKSRAQRLDLELDLKTAPAFSRNMVLERVKRGVLVEVEESRWDPTHWHTCADVDPEAYELQVRASQKKDETPERSPLFSRDMIDSCSSWMEANQGSWSSEQEEDQSENDNDKQDVNTEDIAADNSHTMKQNARYRMISWIEMRRKAEQSDNDMLTDQIFKDNFANQVDSNDETLPDQSSDSFYSTRETTGGKMPAATINEEDVDIDNVSGSSEWTKAEQGSVSSEDEERQRAEVSSSQDVDMESASDSSGWTRTSQWLLTASEDEEYEMI